MPAPSLPKLSAAQRQHVQSSLIDFTTYLEKENPTLRAYHAGTTKWMSDTTRAIMLHPLFQASELNGRSPALVQQEIRTFFRNWKNNTYKKVTPSHSPTSTPAASATPAAPPALVRKLDDAIRGVVILEGDLSPKDLFLREQPDAYRKAYASVKAKLPPGTPSCVLSQKARKDAWEGTNKSFWEKRKRSLELDVARNQELWPQFLRESVQQGFDRGIVGSAVAAIMYAYRTEDDGLQHGVLYAGHSTETKTEIVHQLQNHSDVVKIWVQHADTQLPVPLIRKLHSTVERDDEGAPILPMIDVNDITIRKMTDILTGFLAALWDFGYPADNITPTIPWSRIAADPGNHFDIDQFKPPCTIGDPAPCSPVHAFSLYDFLVKLQGNHTPFRFLAKDEYRKRVNEATQRFLDEWEANDDPMDEFFDGLGDEEFQSSTIAPDIPIDDAFSPEPLNISTSSSDNSNIGPLAIERKTASEAPNVSSPPAQAPDASASTLSTHDANDSAVNGPNVPIPLHGTPGVTPLAFTGFINGSTSSEAAHADPTASKDAKVDGDALDTSNADAAALKTPKDPHTPKEPSSVAQLVTDGGGKPLSERTAPEQEDKPSKKRKAAKSSGAKVINSTAAPGSENTPPADAPSSRRGSSRARKQAQFGLALVAHGQRSPSGRKPAWEYDTSSVIVTKKRRIL